MKRITVDKDYRLEEWGFFENEPDAALREFKRSKIEFALNEASDAIQEAEPRFGVDKHGPEVYIGAEILHIIFPIRAINPEVLGDSGDVEKVRNALLDLASRLVPSETS